MAGVALGDEMVTVQIVAETVPLQPLVDAVHRSAALVLARSGDHRRRTPPGHGGDADAYRAVTEAHRVLMLGRTPPGNVVFADDRSGLGRLTGKLRRRATRPPRVL